METHTPTRDEALALLRRHNTDPALIAHALAVEAVMRFCARKHGEDPDVWGLVGLVHDLDYQEFPAEHCRKTRELLEAAGWPETCVRAAVSHGWGVCCDEEPLSPMEKTLYAIDELTGLVNACALVRPSRSTSDLEPKSVMKKWKDKRFAAGADREVIQRGADRLGVALTDLIADVIQGMRELEARQGSEEPR